MLDFLVSGPRATLTINDPERRNPLSGEVMEGLHRGLLAAVADPGVRVIVITGAGERAFSAGGDLSGGFFDDPVGRHRMRGLIADVFRVMRRGGKPIIARVNGHALAGGFGLAAACDIVLAVERANLGTTEIKVGLWPMQISAVLQRLMPARRALELFMTGRVFGAAEGVELGVVTGVAADLAGLDALVDEYAEVLSRTPAAAMQLGRDAFYLVQDMGLDRALDYLQTGLTAVTMSEEAGEGMRAFLEKRPPSWLADGGAPQKS